MSEGEDLLICVPARGDRRALCSICFRARDSVSSGSMPEGHAGDPRRQGNRLVGLDRLRSGRQRVQRPTGGRAKASLLQYAIPPGSKKQRRAEKPFTFLARQASVAHHKSVLRFPTYLDESRFGGERQVQRKVSASQ